MAGPISLRGGFDGPTLRARILREKARSVTRRQLSLVTIYDGSSLADAALRGVPDHSRLGPSGLISRWVGWSHRGQVHRASLETTTRGVRMIEAGPAPAIQGPYAGDSPISRPLRAGYRNSPCDRGHHAHDAAAVVAFEKSPGLKFLAARACPQLPESVFILITV
jgi:hypothetical protein